MKLNLRIICSYRHLWIGDPGTLRHPIGSCHCSVHPPSPGRCTENPSPDCCCCGCCCSCCFGARLSLSRRISSPHLQRLCPDHHHPALSAAFVGPPTVLRVAVRRRRRRRRRRLLCYRLVLKGRSQLSILRCKEKTPCREVRYRLRNRNYCVFLFAGFATLSDSDAFAVVFARVRLGNMEVEVNANT